MGRRTLRGICRFVFSDQGTSQDVIFILNMNIGKSRGTYLAHGPLQVMTANMTLDASGLQEAGDDMGFGQISGAIRYLHWQAPVTSRNVLIEP
ncbi:hypothetical protein MARINON1_20281 [Marinobacter salarius]|nr:conserved hypothetical protein [Marinobacter salarius]VXB01598.1 hypothetical protein MARINON1_20281 [Marinobacter salarius]